MRSSVVSTRAGRLAWGEREGRRWIRLSSGSQTISDISRTSSCLCIVRTDCPSKEGRSSSGIEPCRLILRSLSAQQRRPRSPQTSTRKHSRNSESFRRQTRSQVCSSALPFHSLPGPAADSPSFVQTLFWLQLPSFVHPAFLPSPYPWPSSATSFGRPPSALRSRSTSSAASCSRCSRNQCVNIPLATLRRPNGPPQNGTNQRPRPSSSSCTTAQRTTLPTFERTGGRWRERLL